MPHSELETSFQNTTQTIIFKLGRIESTLEELKAAQFTQNAAGVTFATDIQKRMTSLEKTRSYAYGAMAIISLFCTTAMTYFLKFMGVPH